MILIGYLLILLITFYLIGRISKNYFREALVLIALKLKMFSDTAHATLLAFGTGMPVLFVAFFAVLHPSDSHYVLALGSITGSVFFYILLLSGLIFTVKKTRITRQVLIRDAIFLAIAALLAWWFFSDEKISFFESLVLPGYFVICVLITVNWRRITDFDEPDENISIMNFRRKIGNSYTEVMQRPIDFALDKLFPPRKYFFGIFFIAIVLIAGLSWVVVESAVRIAALTGLSYALTGQVILAAGLSLPTIIPAFRAANNNKGSSAVNQALAAGMFNLTVGIGLPFLIYVIVSGGSIILSFEAFGGSLKILAAAAIFLVLVFFTARKYIGKITGILFVFLYLTWLAWVLFTA